MWAESLSKRFPDNLYTSLCYSPVVPPTLLRWRREMVVLKKGSLDNIVDGTICQRDEEVFMPPVEEEVVMMCEGDYVSATNASIELPRNAQGHEVIYESCSAVTYAHMNLTVTNLWSRSIRIHESDISMKAVVLNEERRPLDAEMNSILSSFAFPSWLETIILPPGARHEVQGVELALRGCEIEEAGFSTERSFLHIGVIPSSSHIVDAIQDNNWIVFSLNSFILNAEPITDVDLAVTEFTASPVLNEEVSIFAKIFIDAHTVEISRNSYVIKLWYSMDDTMEDILDTSIIVSPSGLAVPAGHNAFHVMSEKYEVPSSEHPSRFCGDVYIIFSVVLLSEDLQESTLKDNFRSQRVIKTCKEDIYAVSKPSFLSRHTLLPDVERSEVIAVTITCTSHPFCDIPGAKGNGQTNYEVKIWVFVKTTSDTHYYTALELGNIEDKDVFPSLGVPFGSRQNETDTRLYFRFPLILRENLVCPENSVAEVELRIQLTEGNQIIDRDRRMENNWVTFEIGHDTPALLCEKDEFVYDVTEFSIGKNQECVAGYRSSYHVVIKIRSQGMLEFRPKSTTEVDIRFLQSKIINPLAFSSDTMKHIGYTPLMGGNYTVEKLSEKSWQYTLDDADGILLSKESVGSSCGDLTNICVAVGKFDLIENNIQRRNEHSSEIGIAGPIMCQQTRIMCKNNVLALKDMSVFQKGAILVSTDTELKISAIIQNVGLKTLYTTEGKLSFTYNFFLTTHTGFDSTALKVPAAFEVSPDDIVSLHKNLGPYEKLVITDSTLRLKIPEYMCQKFLNLIFQVLSPEDEDLTDNYCIHSLMVDCEHRNAVKFSLVNASNVGYVRIMKENLDDTAVSRSYDFTIEIFTIAIHPFFGEAMMLTSQAEMRNIFLTIYISTDDRLDSQDITLAVLSLGGRLVAKHPSVFPEEILNDTGGNYFKNMMKFELTSIDLKYCGFPSALIQISSSRDYKNIGEVDTLIVPLNITCSYDIFKLPDGLFQFQSFQVPMYEGTMTKVKMVMEVTCVDNDVCRLLRDSAEEPGGKVNLQFRIWSSSDRERLKDVIMIATIDKTWSVHPPLSSGFDIASVKRKYEVNGAFLIPPTLSCSRQKYIHAELIPGTSEATANLNLIVIENNIATDEYKFSCASLDNVELVPSFQLSYIDYPSRESQEQVGTIKYDLGVTIYFSNSMILEELPHDSPDLLHFDFEFYLSSTKILFTTTSKLLRHSKTLMQVSALQSRVATSGDALNLYGELEVTSEDIRDICCVGKEIQCYIIAWIDSRDSDASDGFQGKIQEKNEFDNMISATLPVETKVCSNFNPLLSITGINFKEEKDDSGQVLLLHSDIIHMSVEYLIKITSSSFILSASTQSERIKDLITCQILVGQGCFQGMNISLHVMLTGGGAASMMGTVPAQAEQFFQAYLAPEDLLHSDKISKFDYGLLVQSKVDFYAKFDMEVCRKSLNVIGIIGSGEVLESLASKSVDIVCRYNRIRVNKVDLKPNLRSIFPLFAYRATVSIELSNQSPDQAHPEEYVLHACVMKDNMCVGDWMLAKSLQEIYASFILPYEQVHFNFSLELSVDESLCDGPGALNSVINFTVSHEMETNFLAHYYTLPLIINCTFSPMLAFSIFGAEFVDASIVDACVAKCDVEIPVWEAVSTLNVSLLLSVKRKSNFHSGELIGDISLVSNMQYHLVISYEDESTILSHYMLRTSPTDDSERVWVHLNIEELMLSPQVQEFCGKIAFIQFSIKVLPTLAVTTDINQFNNHASKPVYVTCPEDSVSVSNFVHEFLIVNRHHHLMMTFRLGYPDYANVTNLYDISVIASLEIQTALPPAKTVRRVLSPVDVKSRVHPNILELQIMEELFNFDMAYCCDYVNISFDINPTMGWLQKGGYKLSSIKPNTVSQALNCDCSRFDISGNLLLERGQIFENNSTTLINLQVVLTTSRLYNGFLGKNLQLKHCFSKTAFADTQSVEIECGTLHSVQLRDFVRQEDSGSASAIIGSRMEVYAKMLSLKDRMEYPSDYCGSSFLQVVLDYSNDILEGNESNNILEEQVYIRCADDIYHVKADYLEIQQTEGLPYFLLNSSLVVLNLGEARSSPRLFVRSFLHETKDFDMVEAQSLPPYTYIEQLVEFRGDSSKTITFSDDHEHMAVKTIDTVRVVEVPDFLCMMKNPHLSIVVFDMSAAEKVMQNNIVTSLLIQSSSCNCDLQCAQEGTHGLQISLERVNVTALAGMLDIEVSLSFTRTPTKTAEVLPGYIFGKMSASLYARGQVHSLFSDKELSYSMHQKADEEYHVSYFRSYYYKYFATPRTYDQARKACKVAGYQLAIVKDQETFNHLAWQAVGFNQVWIGMFAFVESGHWIWLDGSRGSNIDVLYTASQDLCGALCLSSGRLCTQHCQNERAYVCQGPIKVLDKTQITQDYWTIFHACVGDTLSFTVELNLEEGPREHMKISSDIQDLSEIISNKCGNFHSIMLESIELQYDGFIAGPFIPILAKAQKYVHVEESNLKFNASWKHQAIVMQVPARTQNDTSSVWKPENSFDLQIPTSTGLPVHHILDPHHGNESYFEDVVFPFSIPSGVIPDDLVSYGSLLYVGSYFIDTTAIASNKKPPIIWSPFSFMAKLDEVEVIGIEHWRTIFLHQKPEIYKALEVIAHIQDKSESQLTDDKLSFISLTIAGHENRFSASVVMRSQSDNTVIYHGTHINTSFTISVVPSQNTSRIYEIKISINSINLGEPCYNIVQICLVPSNILSYYVENPRETMRLNQQACTQNIECIEERQMPGNLSWSIMNSSFIIPEIPQKAQAIFYLLRQELFCRQEQSYIDTFTVNLILTENPKLYPGNRTEFVLSSKRLQSELLNLTEYSDPIAFQITDMDTYLPWSFCGKFDQICLEIEICNGEYTSTCTDLSFEQQNCYCIAFNYALSSLYTYGKATDLLNEAYEIKFAFILSVESVRSLSLTTDAIRNILDFSVHTSHSTQTRNCMQNLQLFASLQNFQLKNTTLHCTGYEKVYYISGSFLIKRNCMLSSLIATEMSFLDFRGHSPISSKWCVPIDDYLLRVSITNVNNSINESKLSDNIETAIINGLDSWNSCNRAVLKVSDIELKTDSRIYVGKDEIWGMKGYVAISLSRKFLGKSTSPLSHLNLIAYAKDVHNGTEQNISFGLAVVSSFEKLQASHCESSIHMLQFHGYLNYSSLQDTFSLKSHTLLLWVIEMIPEVNDYFGLPLSPVHGIVTGQNAESLSSPASYREIIKLTTVRFNVQVADFIYPLFLESYVKHIFKLDLVISPPKIIDNRIKLLLENQAGTASTMISSTLHLKDGVNLIQLGQFNVTLNVTALLMDKTPIILKEEISYYRDQAPLNFCGYFSLHLSPWSVLTTTSLLAFIIDPGVSVRTEPDVYMNCTDFFTVSNFRQTSPRPDTSTCDERRGLGYYGNPYAYFVGTTFGLESNVDTTNDIRFFVGSNKTADSGHFYDVDIRYNFLEIPLFSPLSVNQPFLSYIVVLNFEINVNLFNNQKTQNKQSISVHLHASFGSQFVHVGEITTPNLPCAHTSKHVFSVSQFSFLAGESMNHSYSDESPQRDISDFKFHELYHLKVVYYGPGLESVKFADEFYNFRYSFYIQRDETEGQLLKLEHTIPNACIPKMKSSLGNNQILVLDDIETGLGISGEICGNVKVGVIVHWSGESEPRFKDMRGIVSKSIVSIRIECDHDKSRILATHLIPPMLGQQQRITLQKYDEVISHIKYTLGSIVSVEGWFTLLEKSLTCQDDVHWTAILSMDDRIDPADHSLKISKFQILACHPNSEGIQVYAVIGVELPTYDFIENHGRMIVCYQGAYVLIGENFKSQDAITSNNFLSFYINVACLSNTVGMHVKYAHFDEKHHPQSCVMPGEPCQCNPDDRCTTFTYNITVSINFSGFVNNTINPHDVIKHHNINFWSTRHSIQSKHLKTEEAEDGSDTLVKFFGHLFIPNDAFKNKETLSYLVTFKNVALCPTCPYASDISTLKSDIRSVLLSGATRSDSALLDVKIVTSTKAVGLQKRAWSGYLSPYKVFINIECIGTGCGLLFDSLDDNSMRVFLIMQNENHEVGANFVAKQNLMSHLHNQTDTRYKSKFFELTRESMSIIRVNDSSFGLLYGDEGYIELVSTQNRGEKDWFLGSVVELPNHVASDVDYIAEVIWQPLDLLPLPSNGYFLDFSVMHLSSLSAVLDITRDDDLTVYFTIGISSSRFDEGLYQLPVHEDYGFVSERKVFFSFHLSTDEIRSDDDTALGWTMTRTRRLNERWNSYFEHNIAYEYEGQMNVHKYIQGSFCSQFSLTNGTAYLIVSVDEKDYYAEMIEEENNHLSMRLTYAGCDKKIHQPHLRLTADIPTLIHAGRKTEIELGIEEAYYTSHGLIGDDWLKTTHFLDIYLTKPSSIQSNEGFSVVTFKRLFIISELKARNASKNNKIFHGRGSARDGFEFRSHTPICNRHWVVNVMLQSLTFKEQLNITTSSKFSCEVYLLCPEKFISVTPDLQYLPQTALTDVKYQWSFSFLLDSYDSGSAPVKLCHAEDGCKVILRLFYCANESSGIYVSAIQDNCRISDERKFENLLQSQYSCNVNISIMSQNCMTEGRLCYVLMVQDGSHVTQHQAVFPTIVKCFHDSVGTTECDISAELISLSKILDGKETFYQCIIIINTFGKKIEQLEMLLSGRVSKNLDSVDLEKLLDLKLYFDKNEAINTTIHLRTISARIERVQFGYELMTDVSFVFDSLAGWNSLFCGNCRIKMQANYRLGCSDNLRENSDVTDPVFIQCNGDSLQMTDFTINPLQHYSTLSCSTETPVRLEAYVHDYVIGSTAKEQEYFFSAYVSLDPMLDPEYDEKVDLLIDSLSSEFLNGSRLNITAEGMLNLGESCREGFLKYMLIVLEAAGLELVRSNNYIPLRLEHVTDVLSFESVAGDSGFSITSFNLLTKFFLTREVKFRANIGFHIKSVNGITNTKNLTRLKFTLYLSHTSVLDGDSTLIYEKFLHEVTSEEELFKIENYNLQQLQLDSSFSLDSSLIQDRCGLTQLLAVITDPERLFIDKNLKDNVVSLQTVLQCPGDIYAWTSVTIEEADSTPHDLWPGMPQNKDVVTLNPQVLTRIRMRFNLWNIAENDIIYDDIFDLKFSGRLLKVTWDFGKFRDGALKSLQNTPIDILVTIFPSPDICSDNGKNSFTDIIEVELFPNNEHPQFVNVVDSVTYNNLEKFTATVDCNGVFDLVLLETTLTQADSVLTDSQDLTLGINMGLSLKAKATSFLQHVNHTSMKYDADRPKNVLPSESPPTDISMQYEGITFTVVLVYEAENSPFDNTVIFVHHESMEHWMYFYGDWKTNVVGMDVFVSNINFDDQHYFKLCSTPTSFSLKISAFLNDDSKRTYHPLKEANIENNIFTIRHLSLKGCSTDTRIAVDRFKFHTNGALDIPFTSLEFDIALSGFKSNPEVEHLMPVFIFKLCSEPWNHTGMSVQQYIQFSADRNCILLTHRLPGVLSSAFGNNYAHLDISGIEINSLYLTNDTFPLCWKVAFLECVVYDRQNELQEVILGQNILNKNIFIHCGSKLLDECEMGLDVCQSPSVCHNTYEGSECVCPSGKILDQHGNCASKMECHEILSGVCQVLCKDGFYYANGQCLDVDECAAESACGMNSYCSNVDGSYKCICNVGFHKIHTICIDVDNCTTGICQHDFCEELSPGYRCFCNGSVGSSCVHQVASWSSWSNFTECTSTCEKGVKVRTRICSLEAGCPGKFREEVDCVNGLCPDMSLDYCSLVADRCDQLSGRGQCTPFSDGTFRCDCDSEYEPVFRDDGLFVRCSARDHDAESSQDLDGESTIHKPNLTVTAEGEEYHNGFPARNCDKSLFAHIDLDFFLPVTYYHDGNKKLTLFRNLDAVLNGVVVASNSAVSGEWLKTLRYPRITGTFPSQFEAVFMPFWHVLANTSSHVLKEICHEVITPDSQDFHFVKNLFEKKISKEVPEFDVLQLVIITWSGETISRGKTGQTVQFQAIFGTDFNSTYLVYDYSEMGGTAYRSFSDFAMFKGYAITSGSLEKFELSDIHVQSNISQIFNLASLSRTTDIYQLSVTDSQDVCLKWFFQQSHPPTDINLLHDSCPPALSSLQRNLELWELSPMWQESADFMQFLRDSEEKTLFIPWINTDTECYTYKLPPRNGWNVDCCYSKVSGILISDINDWHISGFTRKTNDKNDASYWNEEMHPYLSCCLLTPNRMEIPADLCSLFAEKRPMSGSKLYQPMASGFAGGDPTFLTLDGAIFNVHMPEQYLLLKTDHLLVQFIIDCVEMRRRTSSVITALLFKLLTMKLSIEMHLSDTGGLVVLSNDPIFAPNSIKKAKEGATLDGEAQASFIGSKISEGKVLHSGIELAFSEGISFSIKHVDNSMTFAFHVPSNLRGRVNGLSGNYDGNATNDFITSTRHVLSSMKTKREIVTFGTHEVEAAFAKSWTFGYMRANNIYKEETLATVYPYGFSCNGIQEMPIRSEKDVVSLGSCDGFTDVYRYEICIQQELRSDDTIYLNAMKESLMQMDNISPDSMSNPPDVLHAEEIHWFRNHNLTIPISTMVPSISDVSLKLLTGMGSLKLSSRVPVSVAHERRYYNLTIPSSPEFIRTSSICGRAERISVKSLPILFHEKYAIGVISNKTEAEVLTTKTLRVTACLCEEKSQCQYDKGLVVYDEDLAYPLVEYNWIRIASCYCSGWRCGQWCEISQDPCTFSPCFPGTTCHFQSDNGEYTCGECPHGMVGDGTFCANPSCSDLAEYPECEHECIVSQGIPHCECPHGLTLHNGTSCKDINECDENPLICKQFKSICINVYGTYTCECKPGFKKSLVDSAGFQCIDIDECLSDNGQCEMRCHNSYGSYACSCIAGFKLNKDGYNCSDIDECEDGNLCSQNCKNQIGKYECSCDDGYTLDANKLTCLSIRYCDEGQRISECGDKNMVCSIVNGMPKCNCMTGFKQTSEKECYNIDECLTIPHVCGENSLCTDNMGSYHCVCGDGFKYVDSSAECTNVDECFYENGGCEQQCIDTHGSFICTCFDGYLLNEDGTDCVDVNECLASSLANCHQLAECTNVPGSYSCKCISGYTGSGIECTDVDECANLNGGCAYACVNVERSYYCQCPLGFVLGNDFSSCTDLDECSRMHLHSCRGLANCHNRSPLFICSCPDGYELDAKPDGTSWCEMDSERIHFLNKNLAIKVKCDQCEYGCAVATDDENQVTCICPDGYQLDETNEHCVDINECVNGLSTCDKNSKCINVNGGYTCQCLEGFKFRDNTSIICDLEVDAAWGAWSKWTGCHRDCDYDLQWRTRVCVSHRERFRVCDGKPKEYKLCAEQQCDVSQQEEQNSVLLNFPSVNIMDWMIDMVHGLGFWVSHALSQYCQIAQNFQHCCQGSKPAGSSILPGQFVSNSEHMIISGYPRMMSPENGIEVKIAVKIHRASQFCFVNSNDKKPAADGIDDNLIYLDADLVISALLSQNATGSDVFYMKHQIFNIQNGGVPLDAEPLKSPVYLAGVASLATLYGALFAICVFNNARRHNKRHAS